MTKIDVLMAPDWRRHNPYQQLLCDELTALGVSVRFPSGYRRGLPLWRASLETAERPNVFHLHWQDGYIRRSDRLGRAVYALKLLFDISCIKAAGRRFVWTLHNELPHESSWPALDLKLQAALGRIANTVIVHTRAAADYAAQRLSIPAEKLTVIPHGHYREFYGPGISRQEARAKLGLPGKGKLYLHFGMLRPYKGVEELLSVWSGLPGSANLVVAGEALDPSFGELLRERCASSPDITLRLGYVANQDVALYFSAADFAVLPFRRALTSGSLLLALSYGLPVIAPALPFIQEVADAEYLYDPGDQRGLSSALGRSLAAQALRDPSGSTGKSAEISWSRVAAETIDCYRMARRGSAQPILLDER